MQNCYNFNKIKSDLNTHVSGSSSHDDWTCNRSKLIWSFKSNKHPSKMKNKTMPHQHDEQSNVT